MFQPEAALAARHAWMPRLTDSTKDQRPARARNGAAASAPAGEDLARKLQLTSIALGCSTSKELCLRFAETNPNTAFTAQNAYKWLRGKAMPRISSVYDDWSQVLGGELPASFIAASSFEEFSHRLQEHYALPAAALRRLHAETGSSTTLPSPIPAPRPFWRADQLLTGGFLAVSKAWSQGERGNLIVGRANISIDAQGSFSIDYAETLFGLINVMSGRLLCDGRTAQSAMFCPLSQRQYFLALRAPAPPGNLISGILSGSALHDFAARPMAGRFALVRDHTGSDEPLHRCGYIQADIASLDREIAALGYHSGESREAACASLIAMLTEPAVDGLLEASPEALGAVAIAFDRVAPAAGRASSAG